MDPMRFHHLGIATNDTDRLQSIFHAILGTNVVHYETLDGLHIVFLELDSGYLELLEPIDDGPIATYLSDHGSGIHHIALETENIESALESAREIGVEAIDEEPRPGAWGHQIAFLHPDSTGGVLVEFVQTN